MQGSRWLMVVGSQNDNGQRMELKAYCCCCVKTPWVPCGWHGGKVGIVDGQNLQVDWCSSGADPEMVL